jgi:hypothetical protein
MSGCQKRSSLISNGKRCCMVGNTRHSVHYCLRCLSNGTEQVHPAPLQLSMVCGAMPATAKTMLNKST